MGALEATVLVIDNSEWMRNGDYTPSRSQAQADAVNLLFNAKTQSNPENTVGLLSTAGKAPEVLVTLTNDIGKILSAMHRVKIGGTANLSTGIQIAQLVLKHRQNKNQRQRVIVFVGSPVAEDVKDLVRLGKKLKKNNIAIDVVNFGEDQANTAKLEAFIEAVNSADNSHLATIPPGPHILSDQLLSTPILAGEDGVPAGLGGGFEFGVDPSLDPELAMALRISLEEERARQEAEARNNGGGAAAAAPTSAAPAGGDAMAVDEDAALAQALAMSRGAAPGGAGGFAEMSEEDMLQQALLMSMADAQGAPSPSAAAPSSAAPADDDAVMQDILGTLPGVDPNDPRIKDALNKDKKDGNQ
ncbi:proteasome regulatory particle base subunit rpn10 [Blastocladiella emersonii ATCC 22665]|nr:proteasome regulatory particle base subunit rpn10 [Blastocladiella emersonii ATCC 22665]